MMFRICHVLLAVAAVVPSFASIDVSAYAITPSPTAVMVTFANGPNSRGFSWQTDTTVTESEVRLVAGVDSPTSADFESTPLVYNGSYVQVGSPTAHSHKVVVKGLQPGTTYAYRLGGGGRYAYGRTEVKRVSDKVTIVNLNDAQLKDPSKTWYWDNSLAASVSAVGGSSCVDFIINGGDFIDNAMTNRLGSRVGRSVEWGVAADPVPLYYCGVPWISSSGNHDYAEYGNRMAVEYPAGLTGCESLDYGNVHVATIPYSGSENYASYANLLNWLEADLAANVAKGASDWRIVCIHWGPNTTGDHAMDVPASTNLAVRLGGICASNKVDLVLQAHDHTFSKTLPYRWSGAGWTTAAQDAAAINLVPATSEYSGETWDEDPEGTYYLCAGCAGHRVGENVVYAASTGVHSYVNRLFRIVIGKIAVNSKWGKVGDPASSDLPRSMFGVIRIDGLRLSYDFYVVDLDGSYVLYDKLRIHKTSVPGGSRKGGTQFMIVRNVSAAVAP